MLHIDPEKNQKNISIFHLLLLLPLVENNVLGRGYHSRGHFCHYLLFSSCFIHSSLSSWEHATLEKKLTLWPVACPLAVFPFSHMELQSGLGVVCENFEDRLLVVVI